MLAHARGPAAGDVAVRAKVSYVHRHFPFKPQIFKTAHGNFLHFLQASVSLCFRDVPIFPTIVSMSTEKPSHPPRLSHPHLPPRGARPPPEGRMPLKTLSAAVLKWPGNFFPRVSHVPRCETVACTRHFFKLTFPGMSLRPLFFLFLAESPAAYKRSAT